jgi:uncharacterized protein with NRDE domain
MAVRPDGAFAAVTNYREPLGDRGERSRGELPLRALRAATIEAGLLEIAANGARYGGFHVIAGDRTGLWHVSNRGEPLTRLPPGLHGVSNGPRIDRWPKVRGGLDALGAVLAGAERDGEPGGERGTGPDGELDVDAILAVLADRTVPPDDALPDTGVGIAWERVLGARFVSTEAYGTRVSTVLVVSERVRVVERTWDAGGTTVSLWGDATRVR